MKDFYRVMFSPDEGAGGATDQGGTGEAPGWVAALPDELKGNDWIKGFQKPGDFAKSALDLKTKSETLETRMQGAIFKPGKDAKPEEVAAYRQALGVPDSPDKYDFPKAEGVEHNEQMTTWARGVFHKYGVPQEAAAGITQEWDSFMQAMGASMQEANDAAAAQAVKTAEEALRTEWKQDFDKNLELTKRGYAAFDKLVPGFTELLQSVESAKGVKLGNDPRMSKMFKVIGDAISDDGSFPGFKAPSGNAQGGPGDGLASMYKVPNPPRND